MGPRQRRRSTLAGARRSLSGPAALRLQGRFTELWAEARGGEVLMEDELFSADAVDGRGAATAGVLVSSPSQPVTAARRLLEVLCARAERRLWIYSGYFAPSPMQQRLLESAARRGVDVRVLTANRSTDLPLIRFAGRGNYPRLLDAGVRIWEYQPRMLHAKAFVLDQHLMGVGTLNVDPVSLKLNDETMLIGLDSGLNAALARLFQRDLAAADEIRLETLRAQRFSRRMLERICAPLVRIP